MRREEEDKKKKFKTKTVFKKNTQKRFGISRRAILSQPLTILHYHNKPADGLYQSAQSAITKPLRLSGLKIRHSLLIALESGKSKNDISIELAPGGLFSTCRSQPSGCVLTWWVCASLFSSYKSADPIMKALPSRSHLNLISSQGLHLQIPSLQGLWFQHMQFDSQNWLPSMKCSSDLRG